MFFNWLRAERIASILGAVNPKDSTQTSVEPAEIFTEHPLTTLEVRELHQVGQCVALHRWFAESGGMATVSGCLGDNLPR
ncbi:uncharacterized protein N7446_008167 [Penicillium canescens]|uniref:Uncharacterized protein n=1 Tax=Penicillium canescens TaxID=5083 RepID=A0AAD6NE85_PENCN|nr:uncharacterized protein N7446_008167 [Penicillium canescens]KAJ6033544.1 hypothetical protein N7444_011315 [Penicillium canescens]KAJ6057266.1 hypothetical protein N7460_000540 [Penicillium canescens]KAJ6058584.1 hypothetical protein N7446_008167 [Penicillium canescens]KAJ6170481.1 hypothetical protein N7485_007827 [Penicillium canescens]